MGLVAIKSQKYASTSAIRKTIKMVNRALLFISAIVFALVFFFPQVTKVVASGSLFFDVQPIGETKPVVGQGDAADDIEIWRNEAKPEASIIFGTDKKAGLFLYDISGNQISNFPVGRLNNVDLRDHWLQDGKRHVLIAASNRTRKGVSFFLHDPENAETIHLKDLFIPVDFADPYGLCFYRNSKSKQVYVFVTDKTGNLHQYLLTAAPNQVIQHKLVRSLKLSSISEGCVADDRTGILYVAEENHGIWQITATPDEDAAFKLIAKIDGTKLVADLEGLTLAPEGEKGGYLIASVQGNSTFAIFNLLNNKLVARFKIVKNKEKNINEVTETDGVAFRAGYFNKDMPNGILVVQDDDNEGAPQNFKIVPWSSIKQHLPND